MIRDIVVHLTGSDEDAVRLSYAGPIARLFDAHLTGLQVNVLPEILSITDPSQSAFLKELVTQADQKADLVGYELKDLIDRLAVSSELRRLDVYPGQVGAALAAETRIADLFIGTRPYGDPSGEEQVEETVLLRSGRACLFLPPQGMPPASYGTILVAWKNTREAARAVAEALPFLRKAGKVVVGLIEEEGASERHRVEAGTDIGRYLSRQDVSAEVRDIDGWNDTGEALLNEARLIGADMLVMGGYGHSRLREWVLGGATRHVLTHATIPVMIAH